MVVDPLVGAVGESSVVAAGLDVVTDADRLRPGLGVHANAARMDFPGDDVGRACLVGESVGGGVIVGEHHRLTVGLVCGPPAGETVTVCLSLRAAVNPAVSGKRLEACMIAEAQLGEGVGFPPVGEAMRFVELDGAEGVGKGGEHPTGGADGAELLVVADEHEFGAVAGDEVDEAIEVSGGEHAGFVDDEDLARGERPASGRLLVVVPVEELGDRLAGMFASERNISAAAALAHADTS